MNTKWTVLETDKEDGVVVEADGDEQELLSNTDDAESEKSEENNDEVVKQKDKTDEIESKENTEKKELRRRPRHDRRQKELIERVKHFKNELEKVKSEFAAATTATTANSTVVEIQNKLNAAKQKLAKAKENNDYAAEADATAELSMLALDLRVAQANAKTKPQNEQKTENTNAKNEVESGEQPEAFLDWAEENPWFEEPVTRDERKLRRFVTKKANELIADGYDPNDDDLYEEINEEVKKFVKTNKLKVDGYEFEAEEEKKPAAKTKESPVSGGKDTRITRTKDGKVRIHLTASEREMADRLGVSYADYAKQLKNSASSTKSGYSTIFDN